MILKSSSVPVEMAARVDELLKKMGAAQQQLESLNKEAAELKSFLKL